MERFRRAPAAMSLHHAYIGGLLEHTLSLLRLGNAFCPLYPKLNRDIVLMGLLLHDLGKCMELTWESGFGYSDDGQLVGHIARGVIWLQRKAEDCRAMGADIPEAVLMVLHHIILSHHGKPEFGALKLPSTPEAIAVSLLDNTDAKLQMALAGARADEGPAGPMGGNFTEKIWALETRLYKPDPTTVPDATQ
jgi:3'-5' exoribonuclease